MDGGDHRQTGGLSQQGAHQIAPGAVAVEELIAPLHNHFFQGPANLQQVVPGQDHGGDAQLPGFLGEGAFHKTYHGNVDGMGKILQQGMDVGLGAAAVAAGNEVHDLHGIKTSKEKRKYLCPGGDL